MVQNNWQQLWQSALQFRGELQQTIFHWSSICLCSSIDPGSKDFPWCLGGNKWYHPRKEDCMPLPEGCQQEDSIWRVFMFIPWLLNCNEGAVPTPFWDLVYLWQHGKHHMKPLSFCHVLTTVMTAEHTCTLDSNFPRCALQRGGRLKLDLEGMKSILLLLREQPRLDTCTICPYLEKFLPHVKGVSSQFAVNFLNCVFNYFARKGPDEELCFFNVL